MTVVPAKSQQYQESDDENAEDTIADAGDEPPPDIQDLLALIDNEDVPPSDIDPEPEEGDDASSHFHGGNGAQATGEVPGGPATGEQLSDSD